MSKLCANNSVFVPSELNPFKTKELRLKLFSGTVSVTAKLTCPTVNLTVQQVVKYRKFCFDYTPQPTACF